LTQNQKQSRLAAIVRAMDGSDEVLNTCTLGLKECSDKFPCPIHHEIKHYKDHLRKVMRETTVQELTHDLFKGKTFLKSVRAKKTTR
jgi:Rrf2 family transcriptional regulator, iron-sulfur cluster assembly transcription factor